MVPPVYSALGTTIPTNPPKIPANKARDKGDGGGKRKRRDVADNVPLVE